MGDIPRANPAWETDKAGKEITKPALRDQEGLKMIIIEFYNFKFIHLFFYLFIHLFVYLPLCVLLHCPLVPTLMHSFTLSFSPHPYAFFYIVR